MSANKQKKVDGEIVRWSPTTENCHAKKAVFEMVRIVDNVPQTDKEVQGKKSWLKADRCRFDVAPSHLYVAHSLNPRLRCHLHLLERTLPRSFVDCLASSLGVTIAEEVCGS